MPQESQRLHGVGLSLDLSAPLPEVAADAAQIQQVVLNFLRNSIVQHAHAVAPSTVTAMRVMLPPV